MSAGNLVFGHLAPKYSVRGNDRMSHALLSCRSLITEVETSRRRGGCLLIPVGPSLQVVFTRWPSACKVESPHSFVSDSIRLAADPLSQFKLHFVMVRLSTCPGARLFSTRSWMAPDCQCTKQSSREVQIIPPLARSIPRGASTPPLYSNSVSSSLGQFLIFPRLSLPSTVT